MTKGKRGYLKLAKRFYDYVGGVENLRHMNMKEIDENIKGFVDEMVKGGYIPKLSEKKTIEKLREYVRR